MNKNIDVIRVVRAPVSIKNGFLFGTALLSTKSESNKQKSDMLDPVPQEVEIFFNEAGGEDMMWIHSPAALRVDAITSFYENSAGYTRVDAGETEGFTFRCSYEELAAWLIV